MHEGDHGILDHGNAHAHPAEARQARGSRVIAVVVVAAAVVSFVVWRFL